MCLVQAEAECDAGLTWCWEEGGCAAAGLVDAGICCSHSPHTLRGLCTMHWWAVHHALVGCFTMHCLLIDGPAWPVWPGGCCTMHAAWRPAGLVGPLEKG